MKSAVGLLACGLLLWARLAGASADLGFSYAWSVRIVPWYYNPEGAPAWLDDEAAIRLVTEAAGGWRPCGITLEYAGLTTRSPGIKDGHNVVGWKDDGKDYSAWTYWVARKSGIALEADIILYRNIFDRYRSGGINAQLELRKSLIHEFGHLLGLSHSGEAADAMSVKSHTQPEWTLPSANDIQRCRAIYPLLPDARQGTSE